MFAELKAEIISTFVQWSDDNGYTAYIQVVVDDGVAVPNEFVEGGRIILNISGVATDKMRIAKNALSFSGRFQGRVHEIYVPVERINAIFLKDTDIGLGFPLADSPQLSQAADSADTTPSKAPVFRKLTKTADADKTITKAKSKSVKKPAAAKTKSAGDKTMNKTLNKTMNKTVNSKTNKTIKKPAAKLSKTQKSKK